jgi:hypothetical protein
MTPQSPPVTLLTFAYCIVGYLYVPLFLYPRSTCSWGDDHELETDA